MQKVLALRRANKTYGKAKIAVILNRHYDVNILESTVGCILSFFTAKGKTQPARSRPQKRRQDFSKGYAKGWKYKKYCEMVIGEHV